jgi:glycosyltransferase involved in cell wall biosynthesis
LIISHYWGAAQIGFLYNNMLEMRVKHIWVPHSLGELKKSNVNPDRWMELRIDERIQVETALIDALDGVVSTSSTVKQTLLDDYGYSGPDLFLPPCVNTDRFHPRQVPQDHEIWQFLSDHSGLRPQEIRKCKIISEISRTDTTKRKDVLIKAFARAQEEHPDSLLVVSIDAAYQSLAQALSDLINHLGIRAHTAVVGSIWDILPALYAVTDIYCTPSIMEGFGMSAQEAAATGVPVVSSNLVPFVSEYLLGSEINNYSSGDTQVLVGTGAIVAEADDVEGFSFALNILLSDDNLRETLGRNALKITVPYFTWENMVKILLERIAAD